ncbi:bifunctional GNAT family N-acetyltransferase/nucleoside triphosphate pyrophosphohydrolase family protein [Georgenia subflava]|uniref:GNAT family N-acetyltransferase n=1 Tax=Georgenia subflava TaxID=1622177 RepID=A0A6N7EEX8_9MICO|nr:bifunctional GNAT family N-acetyltransferase/nucleoside triphosphate pyrophosphohydrolase family protein [Georgenia subflava]MPV35733.1 GNAT family N-acetyltransferase [Georgenia subflava]
MDRFALRSPDGTLLLTAPTADDVDRIAELCAEPDIQRWTTVPSPYTRGDAEGFVEHVVGPNWEQGSPTWAIRTVADGHERLVGMIGLDGVEHGKGDLGYWLADEARGNGIMHTAVGLVLDAAFGRLGLGVVQWRADLGNWPSWRVVWRHGFRKEGTVRALNLSRGEWKDGWIGTLRREDAREPVSPWDGPETQSSRAGDTAPAAPVPPSSRDPEALVRQFHDTYALPVVADAPSVDRDRVHMRMALVAEETAELVEAVYGEAAGAEMSAAFTRAVAADDGTRDTVEAADALGDLTYVVYGMALECGIPLDDVLAEIQASNLSKLGADGKPIYREDGKVLKGPGFFPPDIARVLARHGYRPRG